MCAYQCLTVVVTHTEALVSAAELFKALGNESRLRILHLLDSEPLSVGNLVALTGMSQPLVSQHLRTLRNVGLVSSERVGKGVIYDVADVHVAHIVRDALEHTQEPSGLQGPEHCQSQEEELG